MNYYRCDATNAPMNSESSFDWIGRSSGYADFADYAEAHSEDTKKKKKKKKKKQQQQPRNFEYHAFVTCSGQQLDFEPSTVSSRDVTDMANNNNSTVSIQRLAPGFPQIDETIDVSFPGRNNCHSGGPVDVEDLALYLGSENRKIDTLPGACPTSNDDCSFCDRQKSYQESTNSWQQQQQASYSRRPRTKYTQEILALSPEELAHYLDSSGSDASCSIGQSQGFSYPWSAAGCCCRGTTAAFNFCTEERWLECPASDRCPLYGSDATCPLDPSVPPPCAYENLRHDSHSTWSNLCTDYECPASQEDAGFIEDYLSNEKRKERSRDAARCRRSRETDIFVELAGALPLLPEQAAHLDKASVMRLAIAYLKVRAVVDAIPAPLTKSESSAEMDQMFPKALNGFMLVLSSDGNMVYLSENVSDYLGVSQMDMMGQSVYEYSHPCDHNELRECLSTKSLETNEKRTCNFFLRLKCTLTNKGRKVNLKSASYKVIHCTGRLTKMYDANGNWPQADNEEDHPYEETEQSNGTNDVSLVLIGCPIPHPSNIEIPLGRHTFLSKHNLSMKFTYADEKLAEYLGWNSDELVGQSVFEFHHALDNFALDKSFKSLFSKGQCETVAYRFLGKRGGYAWVVTQATLIHCSKQHKPLSVVCVNYILSGVEREDEVYSARQIAGRDSMSSEAGGRTIENSRTAQQQIDSLDSLDSPKAAIAEVLIEKGKNSNSLLPEELLENGLVVVVEEELEKSRERTRPQAVTASLFRRTVGYQSKKTAPAEESLEEALKENSQPLENQTNLRQPRNDFVFQGKPALEYDPESNLRRDRPQAVTRQLFAPLNSSTNHQQQQQEQSFGRPLPQTATASIFAPRTEDMNKGFLTFSEDQPGLTMLKDEPEDLTHLAPTPGDVCVPLEDTPFFSDMLDEFILGNDGYCPLLSPDTTALGSEFRAGDFVAESLKEPDLADDDPSPKNRSLGDSLADSDPFMYGDSPSSPTAVDPSISTSLSKYRQSPEQSVDSLGSPNATSGAEGLSEDEMLMLGIGDGSMGDDELALRAPYIPMSDQDEALELLISDDMVMWGPSQPPEKASATKWLSEEKEQNKYDSSLAQLLRTEQAVARRYNDHGGGLVDPSQVLGQKCRKNIISTTDSGRWSTKVDRIGDRPSKRIRNSTLDSVTSESKRIKCEDSLSAEFSAAPLRLEEDIFVKSPTSRVGDKGVTSSQLLRRLVSQRTISPADARLCASATTLFENNATNEQSTDIEEGGDVGGRLGGKSFPPNSMDDTAGTRQNPPSNSVLMNLLVSGCDDQQLIGSRDVPCLSQKCLVSPLSVDLDNQMVPQCPSSKISVNLDHLSPDTRKQLIGSLSNVTNSSLISQTAAGLMGFDQFEYDIGVASTGLLQGADLLGSSLDRNLA